MLTLVRSTLTAGPRVAAHRTFTSISRVLAARPLPGIEDRFRQGVFYHRLGEKHWAVSFLRHLPENSRTRAIIGTVFGDMELPNEQNLYSKLSENAGFIELLHEVVKANAPNDEHFVQEATMRGSGWVPVIDERAPPVLGRTPDPTDTIGMILVEEGGVIKPETYEESNSYRVATRDGLIKLSPDLDYALRKAMAAESEATPAKPAPSY